MLGQFNFKFRLFSMTHPFFRQMTMKFTFFAKDIFFIILKIFSGEDLWRWQSANPKGFQIENGPEK